MLTDPLLPTAVRNTAYFALLALVLGYPVPLFLAVLMSDLRRSRGLFTALAYLPVVIPPVVAVLLWRFFYDSSPDGVFNTILGWVHLGPFTWLDSARTAMPSLVLEATWAAAGGDGDHLPGGAGLGAAPSCTTRRTWTGPARGARSGTSRCPQLRGVMLITLILQIIGTAQVFLEPYLFTRGGPDNSTTTVLLMIYDYAFGNSLGGDYGAAAALSLMLAVFLAVFSLLFFRVTRAWSDS